MALTRRVVVALLAAGALVVALIAADAAAPAQADNQPAGPRTTSFATALLYSQAAPEANTPGANDTSCRPSATHPRPVVLLHGTAENRYDNWARMAPSLRQAGYCVFALNYGDRDNSALGIDPAIKATGDIRRSARELAAFVGQVLAATGAAQVDIVGHSQGGLMARQYLKFEGGAVPADPARNKVHALITLGATHHGTTLDGLSTLVQTLHLLGVGGPVLGPAANQQMAGSEFLTTLNRGGETVPGVAYTVIATRYDEITTPYQSTFMTAGPGATVRNITLQDGCLLDLADHLSMSYDARAIGYVKNALDPAHAVTPPCVVSLPVL